MNEAKSKQSGKTVYRTQGLDGFIECPRLRFRPVTTIEAKDDPAQAYKRAHVEIKFKKGDQDLGEVGDSLLTYLDPEEDPPANKTMNINDHTITWAVKIARRDVQNVMDEIIQASDQKDNPVKVADEVKNKLGNYVNPQTFTVSSIFCLFEEEEMVDSFQLLDPNRKPIVGGIARDMMKEITAYFSNIQPLREKAGIASPEFPFILGYSISQKLSDISKIDPKASTANTPPYFIPKQFGLTVTPGEGLDQAFITTSGTLNFCMLTHRSGIDGNEKVDIEASDFNAGVIKRTFFDITKTYGKTKDFRGKIQGHDGIMAFSNEIFHKKWLSNLVDSLIIDPINVYPSMFSQGVQGTRISAGDVRISIGGNGPEKKEIANGWSLKKVWKMDPVGVENDGIEPYERRQFALGDCSVSLTFSSETKNIQTVNDGITHARRLYLDLDMRNTILYVFQTKGVNSTFENSEETKSWWNSERKRGYSSWNFHDDDRFGWLNARTLECEIRSFVRIVINPGAVGTWDIVIDKAASKNLMIPGETLGWNTVPRSNIYGNFSSFELHHTFKKFGSTERNHKFQDTIVGWKNNTSASIYNMLTNIIGLNTTVIMPAGEVFTFAGLDTDSQGNLYAQVNYSNEGGVTINKRK
ncbi:hypothetical protein ABW19_dt0203236 [Dactylella cylindrospora]|nr:hypothetical protein ABW19_dt0203236 [Dactylella cylindrospora]